ncbi:MauE/DoxX family redox-associated membrane protein [Rhodopirellula europaea]|uniref:MauE/DoxX family redox-associated membrane protein n=1 Tax=Rhodopirellula europaea TaxID=1263866 RepID=UPI003D296450
MIRSIARVFFAAIFLVPGLFHIADTTSFAWQIAQYQLVDFRLATWMAAPLAIIEILLASAFLLERSNSWVFLLSAGLLAVFSLATGVALGNGRVISCGCLGSHSPELSWGHLLGLLGLTCVAARLAMKPRIAGEVPQWADQRGRR